jgi:hypothetical protein
MLTMRMIGVNDYNVLDDGQHIGRIRFASERMPGVWLNRSPPRRTDAVASRYLVLIGGVSTCCGTAQSRTKNR